MGSASLATQPSPTAFLPSLPTDGSRGRLHPTPPLHASPRLRKRTGKLRVLTIRATHSGLSNVSVESPLDNEVQMTGAAYSFIGATTLLTDEILTSTKKITLVRHGLSSWNAESRVQGSSNLSVLTETGARQAEKCRDALANMKFDVCFSSPISRAKSTAEIIWQGKEQPLVFLDSLKEAHLFFLEGMTNADAKKEYPELYTKWREDPANFHVNGIYPIRKLWGTAREAWKEILLTPGENFLVVTHKSILRALICTALGLPTERRRSTLLLKAPTRAALEPWRAGSLKLLCATVPLHSPSTTTVPPAQSGETPSAESKTRARAGCVVDAATSQAS